MGDTGLEHIQKSRAKQEEVPEGGAESGAVLPSTAVRLPPALIEVITCWSRLSPEVQAAIVAIIRVSH
jgi:hypothetical protein